MRRNLKLALCRAGLTAITVGLTAFMAGPIAADPYVKSGIIGVIMGLITLATNMNAIIKREEKQKLKKNKDGCGGPYILGLIF